MENSVFGLTRQDKWYLGNGRGSVFAPPFPRYLSVPGFWDECHFADIRLERLFTIFLSDGTGKPLPHSVIFDFPTWRPYKVQRSVLWDGGGKQPTSALVECAISPNGTFLYHLGAPQDAGSESSNATARPLNIVLWSLQQKETLQEGKRMATVAEPSVEEDCLVFAYQVQGEKGIRDVWVAIGASRPRVSYSVNLSEMHATEPLWNVTMLPEKFQLVDGEPTLLNEFQADSDWRGSIFGSSLLHLYQHYTLNVQPEEQDSISFGAAISFDRDEAIAMLREDLGYDFKRDSSVDWYQYAKATPKFTSDNEHLNAYLPYRYYGLKLSTVDMGTHPFVHPCVFEGIGMFRSFISYSVQAHMREARWLNDGGHLAEGCLLGMLHVQEESGAFPGHTYTVRDGRAFYHADWGDATLAVYSVTGNDYFLDQAYQGLTLYADYFDRERDVEGSGLYDIIDQNETGQEYMSRYLFADTEADDWRAIRLKGVDATVYIYRLQRALATMERQLGIADGTTWDQKAERTREAILSKMWDPKREMFFDVDPCTGERSPYMAVVGFYPFLYDIAGPEHLGAIRKHLLNPEEFWTPYPVPASPLTDPYFSATAEWKGKRTNCPWNGRTWPMTNSHIADVLANVARTLDPTLRPVAADFILKFIKMMFHDSDPARPNCYEHYNPLIGTPSLYRGVDDYMHSWVADLYIRHLCGLLPDPDGTLTLDPLWEPSSPWTLSDISWRGYTLEVGWTPGEGMYLLRDGVEIMRKMS